MNIGNGMQIQDMRISGLNEHVHGYTVNITNGFVENGGNLRHAHNGTSDQGYRLRIQGVNMTVENGGYLNANTRGFAGASTRGGRGSGTGGGYGCFSCAAGGASHAGWSADGTTSVSDADPYGNAVEPTTMGSGGGDGYDNNGGHGGGAIYLTLNGTLSIRGFLSSDGGAGSSNWGGAGSAGSIYANVNTFEGDGLVSANAGGAVYGGAGSGGRIAIYYNTNNFTGNIQAQGGLSTNANEGAAGTIYMRDLVSGKDYFRSENPAGWSSRYTYLGPDDNGMAALTFWDFEVINGALLRMDLNEETYMDNLRVSGNHEVSDNYPMHITNGLVMATGRIRHEHNYETDAGHRVNIEAQNFVIESGGYVHANSRGYRGAYTRGGNGFGPGGGGGFYSGSAGGGAYGGNGGDGSGANNNGVAYNGDMADAPTKLGSGGGDGWDQNGGYGGGALFMNVNGTLTLNGFITATGQDGSSNYGGGGSGGSVYLTVNDIQGLGTIGADGGGATYGGGGSGGRVSLCYGTNNFVGSVSADGGDSTSGGDGLAGTIRYPVTCEYVKFVIDSFVPADDSVEVGHETNLSMTFRKPVDTQLGSLIIYENGGTIHESIPIDSARVTGNGTTTLIANPNTNLDPNKDYYMTLSTIAVDDEFGDSYPGFSDPTFWNFSTRGITGENWLDNGWLMRVKLTVNKDYVNGEQANMPLYLDMSILPDRFFDNVAADGSDIRMTTYDGSTQVPFEFVWLDQTANTGELFFKANGQSLSAYSNSDWFLYFNNSNATALAANDSYGSENVWTENYAAVWHFDEDPDSSSLLDSTANNNDAAPYNLAGDNLVNSIVGRSIDLDGANEYWQAADSPSLSITNNLTISYWAQPDGFTQRRNPIYKTYGGEYTITHETAGHVSSYGGTAGSDANPYYNLSTIGLGNLSQDTWTYMTFTRDVSGSSALLTWYMDGARINSGILGNVPTADSSAPVQIGEGYVEPFDGILDEMRLSTVARSAGWNETEYNNMFDNESFFGVGHVESPFINPSLVSTVPRDDYNCHTANGNLVMNFDEPMYRGTGSIRIFNNGTNAMFDFTSATDPVKLTGFGTASITLNPSSDFANGMEGYYVQIQNGALVDNWSNNYTGINDTTTWDFATHCYDPWWDPNFQHRVRVTINSDDVNGDVLNFPIFLDFADIADAEFWTHVNEDGSDVRVTKQDGLTQVAREVVSFDRAGQNGELHFVANGTLSSTEDTVFYIYYGNEAAAEPAANSTYGSENVWIQDFIIVNHLDTAPTATIAGSGPINKTASAYGNSSMTAGDLVGGRMGNAINFDSNDQIALGSTGAVSTNFSYGLWTQTSATHQIDTQSTSGTGGTSGQRYIYYPDSNTYSGASVGTNGISVYEHASGYAPSIATWSGSVTSGAWSFVKVVYSGRQPRIYLDGNLVHTGLTSSRTASTPRTIGSYTWGSNVGRYDEARVESVSRSAQWIKTEYNNQANPESFYSIGPEQDGPDIFGPQIQSFTPPDDASGVSITSNLSITFDEIVTPYTGSIDIYNQAGGTLFESINIWSSQISGGGTNTITINPNNDLIKGDSYYVQTNGQIVRDTLLNPYNATLATTDWNFETECDQVGWYRCPWKHRIMLTIDADQVAGDLDNYPVFVDLSDFDGTILFDKVNADGSDIRVTKADGVTEVAQELVFIDTTNNAGELHFVANGNLSATTNSDWYLYFGNPLAQAYANDDTYGEENVWDDDYLAVYHLNQAPSSGLDEIFESTRHHSLATAYGMAATALTDDCKVGKCIDFGGTGSGDYINTSTLSDDNTDLGTVEAYVKHDVLDSNNQRYVTVGSEALVIRKENTGAYHTYGYFEAYEPVTWSTLDTNWHHVVGTWDGDNIYLYVDGNNRGSHVAAGGSTMRAKTSMYMSNGTTEGMNGKIDEVRVSKIRRSVEYITTAYNNQNSPATFYSLGSVESPGDTLAPRAVTISPPNGATGVAINQNLVMNFTEAIYSNGGTITIKDSNDVVHESINSSTFKVTGSGTTSVTINPIADFEQGTTYYVQIDSNAFVDEAGNSYAGISDATTWRFSTDDEVGDWYDAGWNRRLKLTIDHTKVNGDLANFPVYVNMADLGQRPSVPSVVGFTENAINTTLSINCNVPSTARQGDLLIAYFSVENTSDALYIPTGWKDLGLASNSVRQRTMARIVNGNEPGSYTFSGSTTSDKLITIVNVRNGKLGAITQHTGSLGGYSGDYDFPSVNATIDHSLILRASSVNDDGDGGTFSSSERVPRNDVVNIARGQDVGQIVLKKVQHEAGAIGTVRVQTESLDGGAVDYYAGSNLIITPTEAQSSGESLFDYVKSDGGDLRVTKGDGVTELPMELVSIEKIGQEGQLYFLANGTLSGSEDTDYYIYFDNPAASLPAANSTYGSENVWINDYRVVWHMEEIPGATFVDSTSYSNDGTPVSMDDGDSQSGFMGYSPDLDGSNDYIRSTTNASLQPASVTVSAWAYPQTNNTANYYGIVGRNESSPYYGYGIYQQPGFAVSGLFSNPSDNLITPGSGANGVEMNQWQYFTATYDSSTGDSAMYKDGYVVGGGPSFSEALRYNSGSAWFMAGRLYYDVSNYYFDGKIDEVRMSGSPRTHQWIWTEYNNQYSPSTFYSLGDVENQTDNFDPEIVSTVPGDDSHRASKTNNLEILFNDEIYPMSGNITIFEGNGTTFETIPVTDPAVTGIGTNTIYVEHSIFENGDPYYVTIDPNSFADEAGNLFAGLTTNGDWNFTTECSASGNYEGPGSWFNPSWSNRVYITIESDKIDSDLTDFPVYVDLANFPAIFFGGIKSNGSDLRVTSGDGATQIPHELVSIDTVNGTGELYFKAPTLSSFTDTEFYVYYGNPTAPSLPDTDTYGAENVWTNNYIAVYHMDEESNTSQLDSGPADRHASVGAGFGAGQRVSSPTGTGINFDGGNDYYTSPFDMDSYPNLTLTARMNTRSNSGMRIIVGNDNGSFDRAMGVNATNLLLYRGNTQLTSGSHSYDTWYLNNVVYASTYSRQFLNSTQTYNTSQAAGYSGPTYTSIGRSEWSGGSAYYPGYMDEVRMASVARSNDWISAESENFNDQGGFVNILSSDSAAWVTGNWGSRIEININSSLVTANMTNFPVYVDLSMMPDTFFNAVKADGGDIRVTNSGGTQFLPFEVAHIDKINKRGELYFKTNLSASETNQFYIYYGNSGADMPDATDAIGKYNVWQDYLAVWHLDDDPSAGAGSIRNSAQDAYHGTPMGGLLTSDVSDSSFGRAITFDGSNDYILISNSISGFINNYIVNAWITPVNTSTHEILHRGDSFNCSYNPAMSTAYVQENACGGSYLANFTSPNVPGQLTNFTARKSGATLQAIRNAVIEGTDGVGTSANPDGNLVIGARTNNNVIGSFSPGSFDEVRYLLSAKSTDWVTTMHNNMSQPASFVTVGGLKAGDCGGVPEIFALSPVDNAGYVMITSNLSIQFTSQVRTDITSGSIDIFDANGGLFESIPANSGQVTGSYSDTLHITPSSDFAESTKYYVQIDDDAIIGLGDDYFPGIADTTTWNFTTNGDLDIWRSSGFSHRNTITIHNEYVHEDVIDFPVYIDLADMPPEFFTNVQDKGHDIRITRSDGFTEEPLEVTFVDKPGQGGELFFKADYLSSSQDTQFFIYYGNSKVRPRNPNSEFGAESVWTNNYAAVYHLQENPRPFGSSHMKDSTRYRNKARVFGNMNATNSVAGKLGKALDLDGSNDKLVVLDDKSIDFVNGLTMATWIYPHDASNGKMAIEKSDSYSMMIHDTNADFVFYDSATAVLGLRNDDNASSLTTGQWYSMASTYDGVSMESYLDGDHERSYAHAGFIDVTGAPLVIGANGGTYADGLFDEIRLSSIARTAEWIKTEYDNMNTPNNFYTIVQVPETTVTNLQPKIKEVCPTPGVRNFPRHHFIKLIFDRPVFHDSGNITVYREDNTVFKVIDIQSSIVHGDGTPNVIIAIEDEYEKRQKYYITVEKTCFYDQAGTYFEGIQNLEAWTFTTGGDNVREHIHIFGR